MCWLCQPVKHSICKALMPVTDGGSTSLVSSCWGSHQRLPSEPNSRCMWYMPTFSCGIRRPGAESWGLLPQLWPRLTRASCFSYTGKHRSSNMVIIDVKMISGFVPVKSSLDKVRSKVNWVTPGTEKTCHDENRGLVKNHSMVIMFFSSQSNSMPLWLTLLKSPASPWHLARNRMKPTGIQ